jgi:hypothetical protein
LADYPLSTDPISIFPEKDGLWVTSRNELFYIASDAQAEERIAGFDARSVLTALTVTGTHVFLADAGNRIVHKISRDGKTTGRIGDKDERTGAPGFKVPSPYFDLLIDDAGLLRIVNPGRLCVDAYTTDGLYEEPLTWGQAGTRIQDLIGCCNPTHIAQLPDGRFVTAEKGVPRVKTYSRDGEFLGVVVGPEAFGNKNGPADLACDSKGRIYVLDAMRKTIHVFAEKKP